MNDKLTTALLPYMDRNALVLHRDCLKSIFDYIIDTPTEQPDVALDHVRYLRECIQAIDELIATAGDDK